MSVDCDAGRVFGRQFEYGADEALPDGGGGCGCADCCMSARSATLSPPRPFLFLVDNNIFLN